MAKLSPSASVIIPAFNSAATIKACIDALRSQDFPAGAEIIVADDGSADDTAAIAKKAGAKVVSQGNAGPAKARNLGAKNANGEILLFTDADCVPQKNWLSEMMRPFADK